MLATEKPPTFSLHCSLLLVAKCCLQLPNYEILLKYIFETKDLTNIYFEHFLSK